MNTSCITSSLFFPASPSSPSPPSSSSSSSLLTPSKPAPAPQQTLNQMSKQKDDPTGNMWLFKTDKGYFEELVASPAERIGKVKHYIKANTGVSKHYKKGDTAIIWFNGGQQVGAFYTIDEISETDPQTANYKIISFDGTYHRVEADDGRVVKFDLIGNIAKGPSTYVTRLDVHDEPLTVEDVNSEASVGMEVRIVYKLYNNCVLGHNLRFFYHPFSPLGCSLQIYGTNQQIQDKQHLLEIKSNMADSCTYAEWLDEQEKREAELEETTQKEGGKKGKANSRSPQASRDGKKMDGKSVPGEKPQKNAGEIMDEAQGSILEKEVTQQATNESMEDVMDSSLEVDSGVNAQVMDSQQPPDTQATDTQTTIDSQATDLSIEIGNEVITKESSSTSQQTSPSSPSKSSDLSDDDIQLISVTKPQPKKAGRPPKRAKKSTVPKKAKPRPKPKHEPTSISTASLIHITKDDEAKSDQSTTIQSVPTPPISSPPTLPFSSASPLPLLPPLSSPPSPPPISFESVKSDEFDSPPPHSGSPEFCPEESPLKINLYENHISTPSPPSPSHSLSPPEAHNSPKAKTNNKRKTAATDESESLTKKARKSNIITLHTGHFAAVRGESKSIWIAKIRGDYTIDKSTRKWNNTMIDVTWLIETKEFEGRFMLIEDYKEWQAEVAVGSFVKSDVEMRRDEGGLMVVVGGVQALRRLL